MSDLDLIRHIESKLGFKLNQVSLDNLFTKKTFLTQLGYALFYIQSPTFPYKGVRNYSIDEQGNVVGLALDFCGLFVLEDNYLGNFTHLQKLKLKNTRQNDYTFLFKSENLKDLDISGNNLSNVEFLKELTGLTSLDLSGNNLSNVEFLKELTGLTSLDLSGNNLSNVEFLKELRSLNSIDLDNNPITNPPKEIVEQGLEYIWKYFDDIKEQGIDYIYEAKVLIVGETETGKTTLFKKLLNHNYSPEAGSIADKKSTVGINIETWEFPYTVDNRKTIKANLWDFGGQEIQYTLHQYFLTKKSFYIFLISNRVGDNESIHKADYWFKVITLLGKDCPVLVILNERNDKSANNFNIEKYKEQFGKELGEIEKLDVNFSYNDRKWNSLLEAIKEKISNLPHIGKETEEEIAKGIKRGLPKQWVEVRKRIEEIKDNHIKLSEYEDICKDVGIYEEPQNNDNYEFLSQNRLLRFLHDLGIVINYDDAFLRNYLILNPSWLTASLYMVLEDKDIKDKQSGKFTSRFIQNLWKGKSYSLTDYQILLNLMLKDNFEIAYKVLGKEDDYVIPMLLPETPLIYKFDKTNVITLIIRFTFMPHGVFSRLTVQLNNFIDVQNDKQIVWKKGILLKSKEESLAEIIESDDKEQTPKEIKIRVSGENIFENKRFLNHIVNHIYQINKDWFRDNLEFDELIPCICDDCKNQNDISKVSLYKLKDLLRKELKGNETVECNVDDKEAKIREMIDGVYLENARTRSYLAIQNIFNAEASVAQGDNPTANQYKDQ